MASAESKQIPTSAFLTESHGRAVIYYICGYPVVMIKNTMIKENYRRVSLGSQLQRDKSLWWRVDWQQVAGVSAGAGS